jgi:hypothetical protein
MDRPARLLELAADLEALARQLFAINRDATGRGGEEHTRELARLVAFWMAALRRLAASGPGAWSAMETRFDRDPTERPVDHKDPPEGPAEFVAELDVLTAFIVGDMVLDALAYAELVRRDKVPTWRPGDRVPDIWPRFMELLDADPADPMTQPARLLDVTLVHARDVLVAHRDPTLWSLPMYLSEGAVVLHRVTIDEDRKARAAAELDAVNAGLEFSWPETDYKRLLGLVIAIAGNLGPDARGGIKRAYRLAGFDAPPMTRMVEATVRLLRGHVAAIGGNGEGA